MARRRLRPSFYLVFTICVGLLCAAAIVAMVTLVPTVNRARYATDKCVGDTMSLPQCERAAVAPYGSKFQVLQHPTTGVCYVSVPKAASRNIALQLTRLGFGVLDRSHFLSASSPQAVLSEHCGTFLFSFVRDPVERVVAAFEPATAHRGADQAQFEGGIESTVLYENFVRELALLRQLVNRVHPADQQLADNKLHKAFPPAAPPALRTNARPEFSQCPYTRFQGSRAALILPQTHYLSDWEGDLFQLDFLGNVATLADDWETLRTAVLTATHGVLDLSLRPPSTTPVSRSIANWLRRTPAALAALCAFYASDYSCLQPGGRQYSPPRACLL